MIPRLVVLLGLGLSVQGDPCTLEKCFPITESGACFDFCVQNDWSKAVPAGDKDSVCGLCQGMLAHAKTVLESGSDKERVQTIIFRLCELIPFAGVRDKCEAIGRMNFLQLAKVLNTPALHPEVVCEHTGLCSNDRVDRLLALYQRTGPECQQCIRVSEEAKFRIEAMGIQEFVTRAVQSCREMGPQTDACSTIVFENIGPLYDALPLMLGDANACLQRGTCEPAKDASGMPILTAPESGPLEKADKNGELCDFCEDIVQSWREWLLTNRTEEEFKGFLEKLCSETGILDEQCKEIVDSYYPVVFDWLNHNLKPAKLCTIVGFCQARNEAASAMDINVWPMLLSGSPVSGVESVPATPLQAAQPVETIPATPLQAAMPVDKSKPIHFRLPIGERVLGKDEGISYGHDTIEHPVPGKPNVGEDVELFSPVEEPGSKGKELVPEILPHGSSGGPSVVPKKGPFSDPMGMVIGSLLPEGPSEGGAKQCQLCQLVLHYLQQTLMDHSTEEQIKTAVKMVCSTIPETYRGECNDFVDQYGDLVITLLAQEIDPSRVCPLIKLCPGAVEMPPVEPPKKAKLKDDCVLCVNAMQEVLRLLEDQKTEDEIRDTLDKVCSLIPGRKLSQRCKDMVDQYAEEIINTVLIGLTPEEICTFVKLCQPKDADAFPVALPVLETPVVGDQREAMVEAPKKEGSLSVSPGCILCEFVMREVDETLEKGATKEEIQKVLQSVCSKLPSTLVDDCRGFVNEYYSMLMEYLESIPPSEVCRAIKMCAGKPTRDLGRCDLCQMAVEFLDKSLMDSELEGDITRVVEKACRLIPGDAGQKQCRDLLNKNGPYVLYLLSIEADKRKVCALLKQCKPLKKEEKKRMKKGMCKMEPEFICDSVERAKACKKMDYCREHFWKPNQQITLLEV